MLKLKIDYKNALGVCDTYNHTDVLCVVVTVTLAREASFGSNWTR